jgi:hypothetical protein
MSAATTTSTLSAARLAALAAVHRVNARAFLVMLSLHSASSAFNVNSEFM